MVFSETLERIADRRDLDLQAASDLMDYLMSGEASDAQIGAILAALRTKGTTPVELAGFARTMREHALRLDHEFHDLVDTCGTGGGSPSFNISTAAAIVVAAAGGRVAKHGNRAVTSKCGSVDVLETLGIQPVSEPDALKRSLYDHRIAFLFAQAHHPAMRHVGPARKSIGVRTVFNQLGPLANPAGAKRQVIGVYDFRLARGMAEALQMLGAEEALIVHGADGLDEISPCAATFACRVKADSLDEIQLEPRDFGLDPLDSSALKAGDSLAENAAILVEAISDASSKRSLAILPSAAAALVVGNVSGSWEEGAILARETIEAGRAAKLLEALRLSA